jgi:1-acyl-sn-glycerol-3-phosphate acyltransferase
MKILFKIIQPIYSVWSYLIFFLFVAVSIFIAPVIIIAGGKNYIRPLMRYYRFWSDVWFALSFMKQDFTGYEHIDTNRAYVIAGTHSSTLDLFACGSSIKMAYKTLAKVETAKIPVIGYLFRVACLFVDRRQSRKPQSKH